MENEIDAFITVFPPVNANEEGSDEDSGDEDDVNVDNLPRSVLETEAEIEHEEVYEQPSSSTRHFLPERRWRRNKDLSQEKQEFDPQPFEVDTEKTNSFIAGRSAIDVLQLFLTDDIVAEVVSFSNLFAMQKNECLNVTVEEMKCFFAIVMASGYIPLPNFRMFWEKAPDTVEFVAKAMRRDRFASIKQYLHLADNSNLGPNDKFAKLRPFFNALNDIFVKHSPETYFHSIDESMVPYFGHHSSKQCIRNKPVRFGFKFWCGCLPSGYLVWFEPYEGRSTTEYDDLGLGGKVVASYVNRLSEKSDSPHHLVFDNFFSSFKLFDYLHRINIRATGTIRKNRLKGCPLPEDSEMKTKERGFYIYAYEENSETVLCKWKDNNTVCIISNGACVEPSGTAKRWSTKDRRKVDIQQPYLIKVYNNYMGGVDLFDSNIAHLRPRIRGKKWWWSPFVFALQSCFHNAWLLYRMCQPGVTYLQFQRMCCVALLQRYGTVPLQGHLRQGRPSAIAVCARYDRQDHWIIDQKPTQTRCGHCHKKTTTRCEKCNVGIHVHCFKEYHTL